MKPEYKTKFDSLLVEIGACIEARRWAQGKSLHTIWTTCERGNWLLWLLGRMSGTKGWPTRQQVVLAVCDCVETSLPFYEKKFPGDDRVRNVYVVLRKWANGEATLEEVRAARRAAYAAAAAADAYAAAYAAYAAVAAADVAAVAAADVADAAVYAAVYAAARMISFAKSADLVRQRIALSEELFEKYER